MIWVIIVLLALLGIADLIYLFMTSNKSETPGWIYRKWKKKQEENNNGRK